MDRMNLPIEFETKAFGDAGTFEGYAAVFGNVDLGGDVIERGAFKEIVKSKSGKVKVLNQHRSSDVIGLADVKQDDKGLHFSGQLVLEAPSARTAYALMKAGALDGMSIGYDVMEGGGKIMESGIRQLTALKLWEISPVTFGMNPLAGIDSVKSIPEFSTVREAEAWLRDVVNLTHKQAKEFVLCFKKSIIGARDEPTRDESSQAEDVKKFQSFLNSLSEQST